MVASATPATATATATTATSSAAASAEVAQPAALRPLALPEGARVVIKIGSSSLTRPDGGLDLNRIDVMSGLVATLRARGHDVVLVSSGAVAAGCAPLGMRQRPTELNLIQAAAAVGQGHLMARWQTAMSAHGVVAAQVLLTAHDVAVRSHYRTVRDTFDALLGMGAVPIVNENDSVATAEVTLGDNDRLAALVSHLTHADVLILFTDVDGVWTAPPSTPGASPIRMVSDPAQLAHITVGGAGSSVGTGGMTTKIQAATMCAAAGTATLVASASDAVALLSGAQLPSDLGTWFAPTGPHRPSRRLWIAFASTSEGQVRVDAGAVSALLERHTSLLLPGVVECTGDFESGSVIDVLAPDGRTIARGLSRYSHAEISAVLRACDQGAPAPDHVSPVIHRDDLAILPR